MRIVFFGDGLWARLALERILENPSMSVSAVVARFAAPDAELEAATGRIGAPFICVPDVNRPEEVGRFREMGADLFVSMSFDQIMRRELLSVPSRGCVNCHAGALPFYRGRNVLNWAILNGETRAGITAHWMAEAVDEGDIIRQDWITLGREEDYADIYPRASRQCAETLVTALEEIAAGCARRIVQRDIHPVGSYFRKRVPGDEWVDWSKDASGIHNLIRAVTRPALCARSRIEGREIALIKSSPEKDGPVPAGPAGRVLKSTKEGCLVAAGSGAVWIRLAGDPDPDRPAQAPRNAYRPVWPVGSQLENQRREALETNRHIA